MADDAAGTGREVRRARRAWLRDHHPDRGGDLATFLAGPPAERPQQDVRFYRRPRGWRRLTAPATRALARRRAPRRVR